MHIIWPQREVICLDAKMFFDAINFVAHFTSLPTTDYPQLHTFSQFIFVTGQLLSFWASNDTCDDIVGNGHSNVFFVLVLHVETMTMASEYPGRKNHLKTDRF